MSLLINTHSSLLNQIIFYVTTSKSKCTRAGVRVVLHA